MQALPQLRRAAASAALALLPLVGGQRAAEAQLYWDVNGTNPGATDTTSASGTWSSSDPFWTTDPTGASGQTTFTSGSPVVFSAGNNATGTSTITVSGAQTTGGFTVEEGTVILTGNAVSNDLNPVRIDSGAVLQIPNVSAFTTTAGSVVTLDGGTIRNTVPGANSSFWDSHSTWELTSNGGTIDVATAGITRFANSINLQVGTLAAALTKTGVGEFRARTGNFTTLNVNQGLYRIDSSGGTETGFGSVIGTVNVASGAAVGTSAAITSPSTRSFSLATGAAGATFVTNAAWTIGGVVGGAGALVLNGNGFPAAGTQTQTLTLAGTNTYGGATKINFGTLAVTGGSAIPDGSAVTIDPNATANAVFLVNASETIGSLAGGNSSFTTVNLASGTLTAGGDNSNTTYAGLITGPGSLAKTGAGTMTLSGVNNYSGGTRVTSGTLVAANGDALAGGALDVADGAKASAQASLTKALTITSLNTHASGQLDISNDAMVVRGGMTPAQVRAAIVGGFNAGGWNGPGINSSAAASDPNGLTAIGYAANSDVGATDFHGVSGLTSSDVLVRYTYYGDADLDGQVTLDDFSQFLNGYQLQSAATNNWLNGDFDYDGAVTLDDFSQFLFGYHNQGAPLGDLESAIRASTLNSADQAAMLAAIAAVPEPVGLGLLSLMACMFLPRRRFLSSH